MAQSARFNLRMQKELKLLLTDPPPGSSFPSLSSASSLTSIDALLQGPEGSVYADGLFNITIQTPERYPFQPPIVTFATPIYHPNIDNGGRICLDILNLPPKNWQMFVPKGTWQPSLNISTVLLSIRLLLIEPNPDDGLMHEASREYKYNRQAFDQNARFMTQKYARAGESKIAETSHGCQPHLHPHTTDLNRVMEAAVASHESSSRKLSLENLGTCKAPIHDCSTDDRISSEQIQATRKKLSLNDSVASCGWKDQNVHNGYEIMPNRDGEQHEEAMPLLGDFSVSSSTSRLKLKKAGVVGLENKKVKLDHAYKRAGKQVVVAASEAIIVLESDQEEII